MSTREDTLNNLKGTKLKKREIFKTGLTSGLGWAFGVTIGFALVATIMVVVMNQVNTMPWVGETVADIIEATQDQLVKRSILAPSEFDIQGASDTIQKEQ